MNNLPGVIFQLKVADIFANVLDRTLRVKQRLKLIGKIVAIIRLLLQ